MTDYARQCARAAVDPRQGTERAVRQHRV